jgi:23S rRNA-/tRNA-specific pseudouridylate synthase
VAGDTVYGRKKASLNLSRQFLHAHQITIMIPGEAEARTFEAPLAPDLESVLERINNKD